MENDLVQENPDRVIRRKFGDKRIVTIVLGRFSPRERKLFHCSYCGKRVFDYYTEDNIILLMGEMREVARPIDIMCSSNGCKTIYRIT